MNSPVKAAIVGAGWWSGRVHAPALLAHPDVELAVVCDPDAERARRLAEAFEVPRWTTSIAEVADGGIDCAVVASPHHTHFEASAPLLRAGVDVLVEKPMTIEPADAWALVELAARHRAGLHVGYSFLHAPHANRLRGLLDEGSLGEVVFVDALFATSTQAFYRGDMSVQLAEGARFQSMPTTYADPARGGGHLQAQTTHALAMVLWCLRRNARTVTAKTSNRPNGTVDVSDAIALELDGGVLAAVNATGMVPLHDLRVERCMAFGSAGHVLLDEVAETLTVQFPGRQPLVLASPADGSANPLQAPVAALVRSRLTGEPPVVPGLFGATVVEATWAAAVSADRGREIEAQAWRGESA